jgi:hypothetical protein
MPVSSAVARYLGAPASRKPAPKVSRRGSRGASQVVRTFVGKLPVIAGPGGEGNLQVFDQ